MKIRNIIKIATSFLLVLILFIMSTGCENIAQNVANNNSNNSYDEAELIDYSYAVSDVTSLAAQDYIRLTVEDDLQEYYPEYTVDYVECIYISQEYIDEFYYNSLSNIYYGYDYNEIASYMQDTNWVFSVDENGQTVVIEDVGSSNALADIVKKVAIGAGVILICVVVSCASGGAGAAPIACFFAGAAKGAIVGAVSGAAVSGVIGGAISGIQTKSWDGVFEGALTSAADGFMWGAISGALVGGFSSTACFTGDTLVKTNKGYVPICDVSVGDYVYSYNEFANIYEYQPVSDISRRTTKDIVVVSVDNEVINTTPTHPFYTSDGWVEAQNLTVDMSLLTKNGYTQIESIDFCEKNEETWVYNLTVAFNHTYTVSKDNVVVHNACGDSAKLRNNLIAAGDDVPDYPNAAHHIVPSSDSRYISSIRARQKLDALGIPINDASNGVFLSTSKNVAGTTYHRTLHTEAYYNKVAGLLNNAKTKEEGIAVLNYIKQALLNGSFMS